MNEELKTAIEAVGGIEEAKRLIAEMGKPEKWDRARCSAEFLKIIEGIQLRHHPDRPGVNLWDGLVNGERVTLFEQNLKNGTVWCRWKYLWRPFEIHYSEEYADVRSLVKDLLQEHLNWKSSSPVCCFYSRGTMEIKNKWKIETTVPRNRALVSELEEHLKWRIETTW